MFDPLKDLEMGITCFQLTTVVVTFVVLLLVGGSIAMTALILLKLQNEEIPKEAGKF